MQDLPHLCAAARHWPTVIHRRHQATRHWPLTRFHGHTLPFFHEVRVAHRLQGPTSHCFVLCASVRVAPQAVMVRVPPPPPPSPTPRTVADETEPSPRVTAAASLGNNTYRHTHARAQIHKHTHTDTYTRTRTHTNAHTCTRTCIHTHTHTHTHTQSLIQFDVREANHLQSGKFVQFQVSTNAVMGCFPLVTFFAMT